MSEVSEAPPPRLLPIGDEILREATVIRRRSSLFASPRHNTAPAEVVRPPAPTVEKEEEEEGTRTPPMPVLTPGECYREEEDIDSSEQSSVGWSPAPADRRISELSTSTTAGGGHNIPILEKIKRDLDTSFHRNEHLHSKQEVKTEDHLPPFSFPEPTPVVVSTSGKTSPAKSKPVQRSRATSLNATRKRAKAKHPRKKAKRSNAFDFDSENELNTPLRSMASRLKTQSKGVHSATSTERRYLRSPYISTASTVADSGESFQIVNPALRGDNSVSTSVSYRPNVKIPANDQLDSLNWVCAFCGRDSKFLGMGCLYGPYIAGEELAIKDATRDLIAELPIATVYKRGEDVKSALVGASGKTLLKTNSNGALRLVIKSSGGSPQTIPAPTVTRVGRQTGRKQAKMAGARAAPGGGGVMRQSVLSLQSVMPPPPPQQGTVGGVGKVDCRVGESGETWFHMECLLWAPGVFLRGDGKIGGLSEALKMALHATCTTCCRVGAILSCVYRGCTNRFHFYCAHTAEAAFDEEQFTILCSKHKSK